MGISLSDLNLQVQGITDLDVSVRTDGPPAEAPLNTNGSRLGLSPGVLNADWVEALMGYPSGWTRIEPPG